MEAYDVGADAWFPSTPLPAVRALAVLVPIGDSNGTATFLAVGGFNGTSGGDMNPYDLMREVLSMHVHAAPSSRRRLQATGRDHAGPGRVTWTDASLLPEARGFPAAGAANGKVYAIGGFSARTKFDSAEVESLDLASMAWSNCTGAQ